MPKYAFLMDRELDPDGIYGATTIGDIMKTNAMVGVPYDEEMLASASVDFISQVDPWADIFDDADGDALLERYPGAQMRNFDGQPQITEMDALIAYMQVLGTMVDFSTFTPDASR